MARRLPQGSQPAHSGLAGWRGSPNAALTFTDAETITIGLLQSFLVRQ
ncbi:MAG: hypothetical protein ACJ74J_08115 [Blastocatellia bacterium]